MKGQEAVVLQRIQNPTRRYVSFTRRRNGLLKKAYELSLLCDAEVALILFSETGKLYQFANQEMRATLWRYESVSRGGASWASTSDSSALPKSETVQYFEVEREMLGKKKILAEKMQRNLAGEDLEQLSFEELKDLEQKLDRGLKRIRKHKMRILREEVKSLQGTVTEIIKFPFYTLFNHMVDMQWIAFVPPITMVTLESPKTETHDV